MASGEWPPRRWPRRPTAERREADVSADATGRPCLVGEWVRSFGCGHRAPTGFHGNRKNKGLKYTEENKIRRTRRSDDRANGSLFRCPIFFPQCRSVRSAWEWLSNGVATKLRDTPRRLTAESWRCKDQLIVSKRRALV